ncbi:MAG: DUF3047 domain-containing protein [Gemmatimonadales bacterium]
MLSALQLLTNLGMAPVGPGLPPGWRLQRTRHAHPPVFRVTPEHALRVEAENAAGFASYRLAVALRPTPSGGSLTWRWRTATPLPKAALRERDSDDSPVRVLVMFDDKRILFYSWGNTEERGDAFLSWTGDTRAVIVLEGTKDADGSWRQERRDPFADYRRVFARAPPAIVAVGVSADTEMLRAQAAAEVGELEWEANGP